MIDDRIDRLKRLYPAGEYTCDECQRENESGEHFPLSSHLFTQWLCPDCYEKELREDREERRRIYSSGESEPFGEDEITCPWCGYEHEDSWEMADEGRVDCDDCGKPFEYQRDIEVTYSSERLGVD